MPVADDATRTEEFLKQLHTLKPARRDQFAKFWQDLYASGQKTDIRKYIPESCLETGVGKQIFVSVPNSKCAFNALAFFFAPSFKQMAEDPDNEEFISHVLAASAHQDYITLAKTGDVISTAGKFGIHYAAGTAKKITFSRQMVIFTKGHVFVKISPDFYPSPVAHYSELLDEVDTWDLAKIRVSTKAADSGAPLLETSLEPFESEKLGKRQEKILAKKMRHMHISCSSESKQESVEDKPEQLVEYGPEKPNGSFCSIFGVWKIKGQAQEIQAKDSGLTSNIGLSDKASKQEKKVNGMTRAFKSKRLQRRREWANARCRTPPITYVTEEMKPARAETTASRTKNTVAAHALNLRDSLVAISDAPVSLSPTDQSQTYVTNVLVMDPYVPILNGIGPAPSNLQVTAYQKAVATSRLRRYPLYLIQQEKIVKQEENLDNMRYLGAELDSVTDYFKPVEVPTAEKTYNRLTTALITHIVCPAEKLIQFIVGVILFIFKIKAMIYTYPIRCAVFWLTRYRLTARIGYYIEDNFLKAYTATVQALILSSLYYFIYNFFDMENWISFDHTTWERYLNPETIRRFEQYRAHVTDQWNMLKARAEKSTRRKVDLMSTAERYWKEETEKLINMERDMNEDWIHEATHYEYPILGYLVTVIHNHFVTTTYYWTIFCIFYFRIRKAGFRYNGPEIDPHAMHPDCTLEPAQYANLYLKSADIAPRIDKEKRGVHLSVDVKTGLWQSGNTTCYNLDVRNILVALGIAIASTWGTIHENFEHHGHPLIRDIADESTTKVLNRAIGQAKTYLRNDSSVALHLVDVGSKFQKYAPNLMKSFTYSPSVSPYQLDQAITARLRLKKESDATRIMTNIDNVIRARRVLNPLDFADHFELEQIKTGPHMKRLWNVYKAGGNVHFDDDWDNMIAAINRDDYNRPELYNEVLPLGDVNLFEIDPVRRDRDGNILEEGGVRPFGYAYKNEILDILKKIDLHLRRALIRGYVRYEFNGSIVSWKDEIRRTNVHLIRPDEKHGHNPYDEVYTEEAGSVMMMTSMNDSFNSIVKTGRLPTPRFHHHPTYLQNWALGRTCGAQERYVYTFIDSLYYFADFDFDTIPEGRLYAAYVEYPGLPGEYVLPSKCGRFEIRVEDSPQRIEGTYDAPLEMWMRTAGNQADYKHRVIFTRGAYESINLNDMIYVRLADSTKNVQVLSKRGVAEAGVAERPYCPQVERMTHIRADKPNMIWMDQCALMQKKITNRSSKYLTLLLNHCFSNLEDLNITMSSAYPGQIRTQRCLKDNRVIAQKEKGATVSIKEAVIDNMSWVGADVFSDMNTTAAENNKEKFVEVLESKGAARTYFTPFWQVWEEVSRFINLTRPRLFSKRSTARAPKMAVSQSLRQTSTEKDYYYVKDMDPTMIMMSRSLIGDGKQTRMNETTVKTLQTWFKEAPNSQVRTAKFHVVGHSVKKSGSELIEFEFDHKDPINLLSAIFQRQLSARGGPDALYLKRLKRYVDNKYLPRIAKHVEELVQQHLTGQKLSLSVQKWASKYPQAKKDKYLTNMTLQAYDPTLMRKSGVELIVKSGEVWTTESPALSQQGRLKGVKQRPRLICPGNQAFCGWTVYANVVVSAVLRSCSDGYRMGDSLDSLLDSVKTKHRAVKNPRYIATDGSAWDSTQWRELFEIIDYPLLNTLRPIVSLIVADAVRSEFPGADPEAVVSEIYASWLTRETFAAFKIPGIDQYLPNSRETTQMKRKITQVTGRSSQDYVGMWIVDGVMSGRCEVTTNGNTPRNNIVNSFICEDVLQLQPCEYEILSSGDDNQIIMTADHVKGYVEHILANSNRKASDTTLRGVGNVFEDVSVGDVQDFEFCSKQIWTGSDGEAQNMSRELYKSLTTKMQVAHDPGLTPEAWLSSITTASQVEMPHPLLRQIRLTQCAKFGVELGMDAHITRDWLHNKTGDISTQALENWVLRNNIDLQSLYDVAFGVSSQLIVH